MKQKKLTWKNKAKTNRIKNSNIKTKTKQKNDQAKK
jgi:hypothetical protein